MKYFVFWSFNWDIWRYYNTCTISRCPIISCAFVEFRYCYCFRNDINYFVFSGQQVGDNLEGTTKSHCQLPDRLALMSAFNWLTNIPANPTNCRSLHCNLSLKAHERHRWCNGWRHSQICGRSWVRSTIQSSQRLHNLYSMQH